MRPINGVHKGDLRLSGDLTLAGQIRGTVWVMSGTTFDCRGQVVGDVVVEYGGTAVVRGMVVGKILNAGGTVDLFGMVAAVNDSENSRTLFIQAPSSLETKQRLLTSPHPDAPNGLVRPRAEGEGKIARERDLSRNRRPTSAAFDVGASSLGRGS